MQECTYKMFLTFNVNITELRQGHMFKIYGTDRKVLSNTKALSLTVKKLYKMLKFVDGQTDGQTDRQSDYYRAPA